MKHQIYYLVLIALSATLLFSCGNSTKSDKTNDDTEQVEEVDIVYTVICDNTIIRTGPGEEYDGVIDELGTEIMGRDTYSAIWSDNTLIIIETDGDWVKFESVEASQPLSGWIPASCIDM